MKRTALVLLILIAAVSASSSVGAAEAPSASAYIFQNVRIWDGRSDHVRVGEVLVVGNMIEAVSARIATPADLKVIVIDGGGRVLTPGFIDAHVHMTSVLPPQERLENDPVYIATLEIRGAEQALIRGFTTQRDVAGDVFGLKKAIDQGPTLLPTPSAELL